MTKSEQTIILQSVSASNLRKLTLNIILTTYNREEFVARAIESVLEQSFEDYNLHVFDNCSSDNTMKIIMGYSEKDNRVIYHRNSRNLGMIGNFRIATENIGDSKYITFLSSDDYFVDKRLFSDAVKILEDEPSVAICHGKNIIDNRFTRSIEEDFSFQFYRDTFYKLGHVNAIDVLKQFPHCHSISFGATFMRVGQFDQVEKFSPGVYSFDVQIVLQLLKFGDAYFIDYDSYASVRHESSYTSTVQSYSSYRKNMRYIDVAKRNLNSAMLSRKLDLNGWADLMYHNYLNALCFMLLDRDRRALLKVLVFSFRRSMVLALALLRHCVVLFIKRRVRLVIERLQSELGLR